MFYLLDKRLSEEWNSGKIFLCWVNILHSKSESFIILIKNNLIQNNNEKIISNLPIYDIIFPSGYSSDLLRRFHYIETKVIGLKELNYYLTENNQKIFPDDYPNTKSYKEYIKNKTFEKIKKYCLYPPSKRINYQKLLNPYPFYPAWDLLDKFNKDIKKSQENFEIVKNCEKIENEYFKNLNFFNFNEKTDVVENIKNKSSIKIQLNLQLILNPSQRNLLIPLTFEMIGKGKPCYNSLICLPDRSDYESIDKVLNTNKNNKKKNLDFSKNFILNILENPMQKDFILDFENSKKIKKNIFQDLNFVDIKNKDFYSEYKIYKDLYNKGNIDKIKFSSNILDYNFTIKADIEKVQREIIGFVTSGQFSYSNHKGIGKGFITLKAFENILKIKKEILVNSEDEKESKYYVLIRNPGSRNYYFAKFKF